MASAASGGSGASHGSWIGHWGGKSASIGSPLGDIDGTRPSDLYGYSEAVDTVQAGLLLPTLHWSLFRAADPGHNSTRRRVGWTGRGPSELWPGGLSSLFFD